MLLEFLRSLGGGMGAMKQPMPEVQTPQPQTGMFGGLSRFNENNPGALMALGDIVAGNDPYRSFVYGDQLRAQSAEKAESQRKENATRKWLLSKGIAAEEIDAAMATGQIGQYFKRNDASDVRYGLNPVYGKDAEGNTVLGVMGDNGSFKRVDTGDFNISTGVDKVDLGTHYGLIDKRSGQVVGTLPKENFQEAADTARGTKIGAGQGEAAVTYQSMVSKLPGLEYVVGELDKLAEKATYTLGGQAVDWARKQAGMEPREAAVARAEYIAMVDNQILPLLRDTFGAQFTVKEGEALRATLGDPDKSPSEKQAVLKAFIEQKRRDIEALGAQSGQGGMPAPPGEVPQAPTDGWQDMGNGVRIRRKQ